MRTGNDSGKGTFDLHSFSGVVDRMHMRLGIKFLHSLRIKTNFLGRLLFLHFFSDAGCHNDCA